ncbi:hypothetical protein MTO96_002146 [Rhipicephalus appendiculatus]
MVAFIFLLALLQTTPPSAIPGLRWKGTSVSTGLRRTMNPHHRRGKHTVDSSPSSDLFSSGSEGEGYAETRSASIRRDVDVRETARALLSRSADVTRRGVSSAKGPSIGTYTGRPLARQRSPAGTRPRDRAPAATVTSRTRDRSPSTGGRVSSVSPSNRRHKTDHASSSRLHRSGHSSERDIMPRVNLKRTLGTSTIPVADAGAGASPKLMTSSILSSPQRATTGTTDSQLRSSQSVRFSKIGGKRTPKSKEPEIRVPTRTVIPTSTRSFIPGDEESLDDSSSSSSSSSSSEFKVKKTRTRSKGGSKRSAKPTSRAGLSGSRGVHSINARKAPSKRSPRETVVRERRAVDTVRYPSRKGSSDETSSSGSVSTSSATPSFSSTEESGDDGGVPAKEVTLTPSLEKQRRTTAAQTEEPSASRPVYISRASQTDLAKTAKRAFSRPAPSNLTGPNRTLAVSSSVQSAKTTLQDAHRSATGGTSGKVSLPTSSREVARCRDQQETALSTTTTPSIERVSSAEPSTNVVAGDARSSAGLVEKPKGAGVADSSEEIAALRSSSPAIAGRRRFAEKFAHILERLPPQEQDFVEPRVAIAPGDRIQGAVRETPNSIRATSIVGLDGSSDVVGEAPEEQRGCWNNSATSQLGKPPGRMEPSSDVQQEKQGYTQGSVVPQCQESFTDIVHLTPGDDRGRETELVTKAEPATTVATELEPSTSYLGVGVVIPPSMPTEVSVKKPSPTLPTEDTKNRTVTSQSHPPLEWSVAPEPRQEVYVEDADVPISCNGSASVQLDNVSSVAVTGAYGAPYRGDPDPKPQFRPLLCVFETDVSLYRFSGALDGGFRRPLDAELFENISASRLEGTLRHRGRPIPLYVTFGGRRSDSADYVRMLRDSTWRKATVETIANDTGSDRPKYDGVNLDWNHPGDQCDVLKQPQLFHVLVESLVANRVKVMLTVPPLPQYVALYDLDPLLEGVEHVVLTTHKLRPRRSSVDCSGGRLYAAPAFRKIRDSYSAAYRKKFAYSVSVGGDTFVTRTVALGAAAHAVPPPTSGLVLRPNKTSFESVCNVKPMVENPAEKECVVAIMQIEKSLDGGVVYYVAAYAGPKQLQERMHRAYEDDMGDAPVAVYDAFLDDFAGLCPGDSPRMSPQLAAIAESTTRVLQ